MAVERLAKSGRRVGTDGFVGVDEHVLPLLCFADMCARQARPCHDDPSWGWPMCASLYVLSAPLQHRRTACAEGGAGLRTSCANKRWARVTPRAMASGQTAERSTVTHARLPTLRGYLRALFVHIVVISERPR